MKNSDKRLVKNDFVHDFAKETSFLRELIVVNARGEYWSQRDSWKRDTLKKKKQKKNKQTETRV